MACEVYWINFVSTPSRVLEAGKRLLPRFLLLPVRKTTPMGEAHGSLIHLRTDEKPATLCVAWYNGIPYHKFVIWLQNHTSETLQFIIAVLSMSKGLCSVTLSSCSHWTEVDPWEATGMKTAMVNTIAKLTSCSFMVARVLSDFS